jgi:hypothetical protein
MVITVTLMTYMPTQPSMIEVHGLENMRCNATNLERKYVLLHHQSKRSGTMTKFRGDRNNHAAPIHVPLAIIGACLTVSGMLWSLTVLGFHVSPVSIIPLGLLVAGTFISVAALSSGTVARGTHDRCDH